MAPHDLSPAEIASIIERDRPLSALELENLVCNLTDAEMDELIEHMGLGTLARQLPPVLVKVLKVAQRIARTAPPDYEANEIDILIRNLDLSGLESATPPPASPEPPTTPVKTRVTKSMPSTPQAGASGSGAATHGYVIDSPTKVGRVVSWFEAGSHTQGMGGASVHADGSKRQGPQSKAKAYVVFYGREVAVFTAWADASRSITGAGLAIHAGFPSVQAAQAVLDYARTKGWTADSSPHTATAANTSASPSLGDNPLNMGKTNKAWYIVCRGVVPGVYRSYLECSLNASGIKGNLMAKFATRNEAEAAFAATLKGNFVRVILRA
ncbi:hypothetical protein B0H13DRAFT_2385583 [Mycena leptocephala]|nr:hypothetical protein B0H13DRAFT_2385583 [Mycena leptocephala]